MICQPLSNFNSSLVLQEKVPLMKLNRYQYPFINTTYSSQTFNLQSTEPSLPKPYQVTFATQNPTESTHFLQTSSTKHTMVPPQYRCTFSDCKEGAPHVTGHCTDCKGNHCTKHRMLEDHNCPALDKLKTEQYEKNREKLEGEATHVGKGCCMLIK